MILKNEYENPLSRVAQWALVAIAILILPVAANLAVAQTAARSTSLASGQSEPADLFTTVMIAADLQDATKTMTIYDPNEDGFIDTLEQQRLTWRAEIEQYDLNKDGKLTHLEVAVRQAKLRSDSGVTQFDRNNATGNNANEFLTTYDANSDGRVTLLEVETLLGAARKEKGYADDDLAAALRLLTRHDVDRSKFLEKDELMPVSGPGQLSIDQLQRIDSNHDQKLTLEEIAKYLAMEKDQEK